MDKMLVSVRVCFSCARVAPTNPAAASPNASPQFPYTIERQKGDNCATKISDGGALSLLHKLSITIGPLTGGVGLRDPSPSSRCLLVCISPLITTITFKLSKTWNSLLPRRSDALSASHEAPYFVHLKTEPTVKFLTDRSCRPVHRPVLPATDTSTSTILDGILSQKHVDDIGYFPRLSIMSITRPVPLQEAVEVRFKLSVYDSIAEGIIRSSPGGVGGVEMWVAKAFLSGDSQRSIPVQMFKNIVYGRHQSLTRLSRLTAQAHAFLLQVLSFDNASRCKLECQHMLQLSLSFPAPVGCAVNSAMRTGTKQRVQPPVASC
ncbi:hypothetical protein M422DRAFT_247571 [Sphaerobolus stellatus SS14]|uniref:Uncharacterized protein n=1 Tax=Sphaerobolus stellatus (strain SS14) TaxID=990650 RepID=A0A0C9VXW8_SPHS4|nr:hypothetical protein M422DRAFT_253503 [Sphaerobolus stellatus SS14]KIJ48713.1 hypothetical protein M422DRAFT_247571 [Sphaerobolus stellatus SS14]